MKDCKLKTQRKTVKTFLRDVDGGKFAVPKLQREFVWDGPKAAKLMDSISRGMPIGVVLIWETPRSQRLYLRQRYHVLPRFNDRNPKVWFLIDGQQRASVLHNVKEGQSLKNARGNVIDFSRVVLSLEAEKDAQKIHYRKPIPGRFVSLSTVLHPHWQRKLVGLTRRQLSVVRATRARILDYQMHFMFVAMRIDEVRECFLRINTQGMKVTTADAIFTKAEGLDLRDFVHEVRQHLDDDFRDIPDMPILWALAATRGASEARGRAIESVVKKVEEDAGNDQGLRKSLAKDWARLGRCFGKSVDYLRQNFKVLNRGYLYSDYIVSMLALFYYWNGRGPSHRQRDEIRKWFWSTAIASRYSGRNFLRCVPSDARFFRRLSENDKLRFRFRELVDRIDVRKTQYAGHTGIGAAFYSMLLQRGPVSIMDEGLNTIPIERYSTRANRQDRHHIFPRSLLVPMEIPPNLYNSICNICLLTSEENLEIGSRRPWSYLGDVAERKRLFAEKMARHLIPASGESGIWSSDIRRGFNRFIKERQEIICKALEHEAGVRVFRRDS